jgi:hypothetical protein
VRQTHAVMSFEKQSPTFLYIVLSNETFTNSNLPEHTNNEILRFVLKKKRKSCLFFLQASLEQEG